MIDTTEPVHWQRDTESKELRLYQPGRSTPATLLVYSIRSFLDTHRGTDDKSPTTHMNNKDINNVEVERDRDHQVLHSRSGKEHVQERQRKRVEGVEVGLEHPWNHTRDVLTLAHWRTRENFWLEGGEGSRTRSSATVVLSWFRMNQDEVRYSLSGTLGV